MFLFNKIFILEFVKYKIPFIGYNHIKIINPIFLNNKEIMLEAVKDNIFDNALRYASDKIKDDEDVVLQSIINKGYGFSHASERLKDDRNFVLNCVIKNGFVLLHVSNRLKDDKEIVLNAIENYACALSFASNRLKDDEDVVLKAIEKDGLALEFVSNRLKNNKDITMKAIKNNGFALIYALTQFQNDKTIVLEAFKDKSNILEYASEELQNNIEFLLEAVKVNAYVINEINNKFKNNNFIINCILINNKIIQYFEKNKLYVLIHNLHYNNYKEYIIYDNIFLKNLNYICKLPNFEEILDYILNNNLKFFIKNYKKFIKYIINSFEYIKICQLYNIHIFSIDDITSDKEYNIKEVYNIYKFKYEGQYILLY